MAASRSGRDVRSRVRAPSSAARSTAARTSAEPTPPPRTASSTTTSSIHARTPVGTRKTARVSAPTIRPVPSRATNRVVAGARTIASSSWAVGGGALRDSCGTSRAIASTSSVSATTACSTATGPSPAADALSGAVTSRFRLGAPPHRLAHAVVEDVAPLTSEGGEDVLAPPLVADERRRQRPLAEPPHITAFERVGLEPSAHRLAVEDERVERDAGEAEPEAVEDGDQPHRLHIDAGLLPDLLHHHLGRGVAHVAPAGGIEPHPRVRPLDEEQLPLVVAHRRADRPLRSDVAGPAPRDRAEPLLNE